MAQLRAVLGASLVALCACALAAAPAGATTLHACEETAPGATAQEFTTATCETAGAGKFRTVPIAEKTAVTPTAVTNQVFSSTIGGVTVEIVCTGMGGTGSAENIVIGPLMFGADKNVTNKYFECKVTKPAGGECKLKKAEPPLEGEKLRYMSVDEGAIMKVELFSELAVRLVTITLEGCKVAMLNGERGLTGTARGIVGVDPSIIEFTPSSGSTLELGGHPASYTGDVRLFMEGTTKRLAFETP